MLLHSRATVVTQSSVVRPSSVKSIFSDPVKQSNAKLDGKVPFHRISRPFWALSFWALLDYVSRAPGIGSLSVVRHPCRNYLRTHWADSFQISVVASLGQYLQMFFGFLKKRMHFQIFQDFFPYCVNHVNVGPYGSQNFKTLLLPQITFESFQTFSEFSSQWSWQTYCFGFLKLLSFWFFTIFFSC